MDTHETSINATKYTVKCKPEIYVSNSRVSVCVKFNSQVTDFVLLWSIIRRTFHDLLLSIFLFTSDIEVEPKCLGTLRDAYRKWHASN